MSDEVLSAHTALLEYLGDPWFFRPPAGAWNDSVRAALDTDPVLWQYTGPILWDIGGHNYHAADYKCWGEGVSPEECGLRYLTEIQAKQGGTAGPRFASFARMKN